jgi:hypothetical protein
MNRRDVLTLFAFALAGCAGQSGPTSPAPTRTASATPTAADAATAAETETATERPTPTETATETPTDTPEPTETAEPTPSEGERQAAQAIADTRREFRALLEAYCSEIDEDDDITEVTAATAFYGRGVQSQLAEVQDALNAARKRAVTEQQRQTVASFEASWQAVRLMRRAQEPLVDAFGFLRAAHERASEEDEGRMYAAIEDMDTTYRDARAPKNDLDADVDGDSLGAVDDLETSVYETKVTQFDGEVAAFDDVEPIFRDFQEGINSLGDARRARSSGNDEDGREHASDASDVLGGVAADLEDLADDPPAGAGSFEELLREAADVATEKEEAARDLY